MHINGERRQKHLRRCCVDVMCIGCIGFGIGTDIWHVYYINNCKQCGVLNMFDFLPFWSILARIFFVCLECMVLFSGPCHTKCNARLR